MSSQTHTFNAYESNLAGPLAAGATSVAVVSLLGIEAPAYLVIDPDDDLKREYIKITAITTNTIDAMERGLEGSNGPGGTGVEHLSDAPIRAIFTAQLQDDIFFDINALETFDSDHLIDSDPHPVYLTPAEGNNFYLRLDGTTVPTADIALGNNKITGLANATADADAVRRDQVLAADAAHVAAPEPHANYVKLAGDTMSGILDMGNSKITSLGAPTANGDAATKQFVDDEISALPAPFSGAHGDLTGIGPDNHHVKYLDSDAVTAMGGVGDGNPLNHAKFTDANAVTAVASTHYTKTEIDALLAALTIPASRVTAGSFTGVFTFLGSVGIAGAFNANSSVDLSGLPTDAGGVALRLIGNSVRKAS